METVEELKTKIEKLKEDRELFFYLYYVRVVKDCENDLKKFEKALEDCSEEDREDLEDLHKKQNKNLLRAYDLLAKLRKKWPDKKIEKHLKKLARGKYCSEEDRKILGDFYYETI